MEDEERQCYAWHIYVELRHSVLWGGAGGGGGGGACTDSSSFSSKTMDWLQTAVVSGTTEEVQEIAMESESTVHPDQ